MSTTSISVRKLTKRFRSKADMNEYMTKSVSLTFSRPLTNYLCFLQWATSFLPSFLKEYNLEIHA